ncbi:MAG: hypothetical protein ACFFDT_25960 [Candidatus Hodarchaeota archaeon]
MGRRRRKTVRIPKKRLPKLFSCPSCGKQTVRVQISRETAQAVVGCSTCGLKENFEVSSAQAEIDIYCTFTDNFYKKFEETSLYT